MVCISKLLRVYYITIYQNITKPVNKGACPLELYKGACSLVHRSCLQLKYFYSYKTASKLVCL